MFTLTINPQPFTLQIDMSQVESFNETTGLLKLFNIEQKVVTEDIAGNSFTTNKSYDKKYEIDGFLDASNLASLVALVTGQATDITISGFVNSNTDATMKATADVGGVVQNSATITPPPTL